MYIPMFKWTRNRVKRRMCMRVNGKVVYIGNDSLIVICVSEQVL